MNPYLPIRKVPLDYNGIQSSAFSVQTERPPKPSKDGMSMTIPTWKEAGVVKHSYLLIPNQEVKDLVDQLTTSTPWTWNVVREFFDGKRFVYTLATKDLQHEVAVGDAIGLGINAWNSYDGSVSFHLRFMAYRLICLNGMTSNDSFFQYRFKHDKSSEGYAEEIDKAGKLFDQADTKLADFCDRAKKLLRPMPIKELQDIRNNYVRDLPTSVWGKVVDKLFADKAKTPSTYTAWDVMNAATATLWHNDKPTVSDYKHNQYCVDNLLRYGAEA
jgi:hypothetical protein